METRGNIAVASKLPNSLRELLTGAACPNEQALAAYADHQLIGTERHAVEHHLSTCDPCTAQVAFLVRSNAMDADPVPDVLVAKALRFGRQQSSRTAASWSMVGAGAFVLFIGISLAVQHSNRGRSEKAATEVATLTPPSQHHSDKATSETDTRHPELRGSEPIQSPFLFPTPNQQVDSANLDFRWKEFAGAESYEIELLSDDGTYLWGKKVSTPTASLPKSIHLIKGRTYFLKLSIHDTHGSIEQTKAIGFVAR